MRLMASFQSKKEEQDFLILLSGKNPCGTLEFHKGQHCCSFVSKNTAMLEELLSSLQSKGVDAIIYNR